MRSVYNGGLTREQSLFFNTNCCFIDVAREEFTIDIAFVNDFDF